MAGPLRTPMGLRERKRLQTFGALQAAAQRLVAEHGVEAVTVDDIAAAANVSPRTFFNYFDSKYAAVVEAPPGVAELLTQALAAQPADKPTLTAWRDGWAQILPYTADELHHKILLVRANPALAAAYRAAVGKFEQVIVDWAAARTGIDPAHTVYPQLLGAIAVAALNLVFERWQPDTGAAGLLAIHSEIFDLLQAGLDCPGPRQ